MKKNNKEKKKMANNRRRNLAKQRLTADPNKFPLGEDVKDHLSRIRSIPDGAIIKELFLWELVRNSARALYLVRRESLVDKNKFGDPPKLFIRIVVDKTNHTLSVIDSGIGMTRDDLVNKLGASRPLACQNKYMQTIDRYSAPDADVDDLSYLYSEDCLLIGVGTYSSYMVAHVGLGFYSAYMVADKVVITTKQKGHEQYVWEFDANADENHASFTVDARDTSGGGDTLDRGTKVTLHLREGLEYREYLEERKSQALVNKYSKYICPYPISISSVDENKNPIEKQIVADDGDKEK